MLTYEATFNPWTELTRIKGYVIADTCLILYY